MPYKNKEQQREYQRKWMAQRRADFFQDKSCAVCSVTDNLELDHIDRETKVSHSIWSWSEKRRSEEIAKCQILCYDHHKEKTRSENIVEYCSRGHLQIPENRKNSGNGRTECRPCDAVRARERRARR